MLVVLDLSASRCIKHGVQFCNCPEGFLSIKEMHPDDEFCFADEISKQSFTAFMDFIEAMGWTLDEYYAEKNHLDDEDDEPLPDPIHDEVEFINAFCDDDYEETLLSIFLETMGITEEDYKAMQEYYDTVGFQHAIDDAEYEKECEEYEQALYEEYSWYIHARQMGWE